jgi:general secretion pathway protein A
MYEQFYGLREAPFELTPNPKFLFLSPPHREALSNLTYAVLACKGITLLVGQAGTGKTTIIHALLATNGNGSGHRFLNLENPTLTRDEFYEFLGGAFDLPADASGSKARLLAHLERVLLERRQRDVLCALIIDEVQAMPEELLEEVRLLANIETATDKLLPIVLSGQPELADRLNRPSLRQLKQRVALRCELSPLDARETGEYIAGRIRIAGGSSAMVFTRQAVDVIYKHSRGIPRLISVICDNALISGFAADRRPVDRELVEEVCKDFDLVGVAEPAARPAVAAPQPAAVDASPQPAKGLFEHFTVRRRFSLF